MKISQEIHSQMESINKNVRSVKEGNKSFNQIVQSQTSKLQQQGLQKLLNDIVIQGDKLARFRSFRDLAKFKRMVKSFLQEVIDDGLELEKSYGFMSTESRSLTIVKEIDAKLVALAEEMMDQEKKTIDILDIIGEIKGLLINLYT